MARSAVASRWRFQAANSIVLRLWYVYRPQQPLGREVPAVMKGCCVSQAVYRERWGNTKCFLSSYSAAKTDDLRCGRLIDESLLCPHRSISSPSSSLALSLPAKMSSIESSSISAKCNTESLQ